MEMLSNIIDGVANVSSESLAQFCKRYFICRLSIFGSTLHGDSKPASDIDILVEFLPRHTPGFAFARIEDELSDLFRKPVDLHTAPSLSQYFREEIVQEARTIYAHA